MKLSDVKKMLKLEESLLGNLKKEKCRLAKKLKNEKDPKEIKMLKKEVQALEAQIKKEE